MVWYCYLAYRIYKYYEKKDSMPAFYSFLAITTLITINIEAIAGAIHLFYPYLPDNSKYYAVLLIGVVALINYFILYRSGRYKMIFNDFDLYGKDYKRWNLFVNVYIMASVIVLLLTLVLADLKNHGRL